MQRWRLWIAERAGADTGSASLEFVTAGLILLLPVVYLVLTMSAVQGAALATEGAARQAVRVFVQADSTARAQAEAQRAVDFALADYGLNGSDARVAIRCAPHPSDCLTRRGQVSVTVAVSVPLPLVPPALTVQVPLEVPLEATASEQVSRFWGTR
ncbi:hypothetical protein [Lacisediminihabitans changchengi]|uniref:TadE family protein n=1 Tax=Lacisediminihabitans changchengi TaxID=2787634 RepID=A0A934SL89_9MICO|nr:hypothetical protein [Lacisediminihabitans changchengi]MBK4347410.1 hypothetical protein [Lacisediminihabitans changchengi]